MTYKLLSEGAYEKLLTWWQKTTKTCCSLNYMGNVWCVILHSATRHIVWHIFKCTHRIIIRSDHFNYWGICVSLSWEIELILTLYTTYAEKCIYESASSMHEMGTTGINLHALWIMTAECADTHAFHFKSNMFKKIFLSLLAHAKR